MASFNPGVPDQRDPSYLNYSRGISQPDSNKTAVYSGQVDKAMGEASQHLGEANLYKGTEAKYSGEGLGTLFEGIGNLFKQGVNAADTFLKKQIDDKVYSAVDAERNEYTQQLEQTKAPDTGDTAFGLASSDTLVHTDPKTGKPITPGAPMDIIQQGASAPDGIDKGMNRLGTIVEARANDKMTETAYIGNLNSIVKGLRTQYPGYREYIDEQVSKVTGMIPANAYVKSLIQDINANVSASKGITDQVRNALFEETKTGTQGAREAYLSFLQTGNINTATSWLSKTNAQKAYWKTQQDENAYDSSVASNEKLKAEQKLGTLAPMLMDNHFDGIAMTLAGKGIGTGTTKALVNLMQNQMQIQLGTGTGQKVDQDTARQIGLMIRSQAEDYKAALRADAIQKGIYQKIDPADFEKRVDAYAKKFTDIADLIHNEKWGLAAEQLNQNRAMAAIDQNKMMTSKELGVQTRLINAAKDWPQFAEKFFQRLISSSEIGADGKPLPNLNDGMKDYVKQQRMLMQIPPADVLKNPQSFRQSILNLNDKVGGSENTPIAATKIVLEGIKDVTDPKIEDGVKINTINAAFLPANRGMLNEIQKDYVNRRGQKVQGQIDIYKDFTSPQMTDEVARLSKQNPTLMRNYQSWAKDEFSNVLLRQDIQSLADVQTYKGMVVTFTSDPKTGVARFSLAPTKLPTYDPQDVGTQPGIISERRMKAEYHLDRINQGLENYAYIVKQAGGDINAEVVQMLGSKGIDPKGINMRIPEYMLEAVLRSQQKPEDATKPSDTKTKPETMKAQPFSAEDTLSQPQRGSLGDYLSNPARGVPASTQNAPARPPARVRGNLTDEDLLGIETTNLPIPPAPRR